MIAGDLYDGTWRDYKTGLFFAEQIGATQAGENSCLRSARQSRCGEPNHQTACTAGQRARLRSAKGADVPAGKAKCSSARPQFSRESRDRQSGARLPSTSRGRLSTLECFTRLWVALGAHANYAPCSLPELVAKGYDYWALGHVHQGRVLNERPHVVFPGNLQGRHVREVGPKGAFLVTVEEGQVVDVAALTFDVVRWEVLDVDVESADSKVDVIESDTASPGAGGDERRWAAVIGAGRVAGPDRASQ